MGYCRGMWLKVQHNYQQSSYTQSQLVFSTHVSFSTLSAGAEEDVLAELCMAARSTTLTQPSTMGCSACTLHARSPRCAPQSLSSACPLIYMNWSGTVPSHATNTPSPSSYFLSVYHNVIQSQHSTISPDTRLGQWARWGPIGGFLRGNNQVGLQGFSKLFVNRHTAHTV